MFYFTLNNFQYKKIHFIGIGGVSMSGIAGLLKNKGYEITGSDRSEGVYVKHLKKMGVPIAIGQKKENITDQDLFVYTDAIPEMNEELIAARNTQKPVVSRGQFLGALMRNYKKSIAVSGSHGKSTTTSLIASILLQSKEDASILLGASFDGIEGNSKLGSSEIFLAEACEYKGNIRYYFPEIAVILNIDEDHLDYFKNMEDIIDCFKQYMKNLSPSSKAILNFDDENCRKITSAVPGKMITFSLTSTEADYYASDIKFNHIGQPRFTVHLPDGKEMDIDLQILGKFNISNALAAIAACYEAEIEFEAIQMGLNSFQSLHRRMEIVGEFEEATVLTDYGHHPIEIQLTLETLAEHKKERLICVFQPHTYSRTKALMEAFSHAFYAADEVVVTDIMGAREVDDGSVHATELVEKLKNNGVKVSYQASFDDVENFLHGKVKQGDLILTTGCGNIDELAYQMVKKEIDYL